MNLNWKAASGYVQGIGHVENNEPCQDRAIHIHDEDLHGIVLADGAGSCRLGERGAELVVQSFLQYSKDKFDEWYATENPALLIEEFLLKVIDEEVAKHGSAERMDFSCTVLFVLVKNNQFLSGHIGDGVIFQRINNELSVLSHPENGRYINETYFITMAPLNEHFRIYKGPIEKHMDFMLMSDGAATSFYIHSDREIEESNTNILFDHLVENEEQLFIEELPAFLNMVKENTSDDCAIALMTSHTIDMIELFEGSVLEAGPDTLVEGGNLVNLEDEAMGGQNSIPTEVEEKDLETYDVGINPMAIKEKKNIETDTYDQQETLSEPINIENFQLDLLEHDEEIGGDSPLFIGNEEDYSPEFEDEENHDYEREFEYDEDTDYTSESVDEEDRKEPEYLPEYIDEGIKQAVTSEIEEEKTTYVEVVHDGDLNLRDFPSEVVDKEEKMHSNVEEVEEDSFFETEEFDHVYVEDFEEEKEDVDIQHHVAQSDGGEDSVTKQKEENAPDYASTLKGAIQENSSITVDQENRSGKSEE